MLLLHGFLQTREFPVVQSLGDALVESGYSVLRPTLSLGISRRARSLPCEALHTHRMDDDLGEIDQWVRWLEGQGHERIVLAGHSFGSKQVLIYAARHPRPSVIKLVAISLVDQETPYNAEVFYSQLADARVAVKAGENPIKRWSISFCNEYPAPAEAFLSYADWGRREILALIPELQQPLRVIMGGQDVRMGTAWKEDLTAAGAEVNTVEGANHFFDSLHGFDLIDVVEGLLEDGEPGTEARS